MKGERFVEGQLNVVELPEDSPSVFAAFYYFILHHDELAFNPVCIETDGIEACCEQLKLCIDIWIFGDKIGMLKLQNAAMRRACFIATECAIRKGLIPAAVLEACFSKTLPNSPLQVLAADYVVDCMVEEPEKSAHLLHHLSLIEGFATALQKSQKYYHGQKFDVYPEAGFPRYFDPYSYPEVFYLTSLKQEKTNVYTYDGQPGEKVLRCSDCKVVGSEVELKCTSCVPGSNDEEEAAVPLCEDCAYKRQY